MLAILASGWYLRQEWTALGTFGFPLDDGWIHAQFAKNLASGYGLAFNPGEPSAGSTSPLWTLVLAAVIAVGASPVAAAKAGGVVLGAATAALGSRLARTMTGSAAAGVLAGFALAVSARLTWAGASGMEVGLACTLLIATLLVYLTRPERTATWGVLSGLCGTARPELFPLVGALLVHALVWGPIDVDPPPWSRLRRLVPAAAGFVVVAGVYALANWYGGGTWLPTTFAAKTKAQGLSYAIAAVDGRELVRSLTSRPIEHLSLLARFVFEQSQVLFATLVLGELAAAGVVSAAPCARGSGLVAGVVVGLSALMGALAPDVPLYGQEGRYVLPFVSLLFVLGAVGVWALGQTLHVRWPAVALALVALARLGSQDVQFASRYVAQVANIEHLQVEMGRWLAAHTAGDTVVATNDIGAIGVFSGRRVVDTEGLITPAMIPFKRDRRQLDYLFLAKPDVLVVFPEWYPHVVGRTDLFTEIHRISVPRVSAAHDAMVVYRTPWSRPGTLALAADPHERE
ncbi:MAG: hypothetical protein U0Q12_03185 [Vicinamibacterales bacterium]